VELGVIGFMKAAFGLRLAPDFLAFGALLVAAFFIGFLAADLRPAFFDLPFLAAIDESSNQMVTLGSVHLAFQARQREDAQAENDLSTDFTREIAFRQGLVSPAQHAVSYCL